MDLDSVLSRKQSSIGAPVLHQDYESNVYKACKYVPRVCTSFPEHVMVMISGCKDPKYVNPRDDKGIVVMFSYQPIHKAGVWAHPVACNQHAGNASHEQREYGFPCHECKHDGQHGGNKRPKTELDWWI